MTACVAAAPAAACDGVEAVMAVPDGPALPHSTTDGVLGGRCVGGGGGIVMVDSDVRLGDRPGTHYFGGSCSLDGPQANTWVTQDMSLAVSTPAGRWGDEGAAVVAGLYLTNWPRQAGSAVLNATTTTVDAPAPTG